MEIKLKKFIQLLFFLVTIAVLGGASSFVSIWVFMLFSVENFDEFIKLLGYIFISSFLSLGVLWLYVKTYGVGGLYKFN